MNSPFWRYMGWPLLLAGILLLSGVAVKRGFANLAEATEELDSLRASNQRLERENRSLYRQVLRLRGDPLALERACRRDMGLVRADEVVYQAPNPSSGPPGLGNN